MCHQLPLMVYVWQDFYTLAFDPVKEWSLAGDDNKPYKMLLSQPCVLTSTVYGRDVAMGHLQGDWGLGIHTVHCSCEGGGAYTWQNLFHEKNTTDSNRIVWGLAPSHSKQTSRSVWLEATYAGDDQPDPEGNQMKPAGC